MQNQTEQPSGSPKKRTARPAGKSRLLKSLLVLFLLAFSFLYYCFNIEPYMVQTEYLQLQTEGAQETVRIALFSDTHLKKNFPVSALWKVVETLNAQHPDIVVFLGDLYDDYDSWHDDEAVIEALRAIQAPLGKLAVWGNRDYGGGAQQAYLSLLDESGFTLLQNSNWYIPVSEEHSVLFTGLDDGVFGQPVYPLKSQVFDSSLRILLMHEPDAAREFWQVPSDLTLSGHTHGQQTALAFLALNARDLQSAYSRGLYEEEEGLLYVTSGIGTTHISARFLMPPSITVIDAGLS